MLKINKRKAEKLVKQTKKKEMKRINKNIIKSLNLIDKEIKKAAKKGKTSIYIQFHAGGYSRKKDPWSDIITIGHRNIMGEEFRYKLKSNLLERGFYIYIDNAFSRSANDYVKLLQINWDSEENED